MDSSFANDSGDHDSSADLGGNDHLKQPILPDYLGHQNHTGSPEDDSTSASLLPLAPTDAHEETELATDSNKPRKKIPYKSFKKKYRKMEIQFAKVMKRSEDLYRQNLQARKTFDRLLREKSRLLDILLEIYENSDQPDLGYSDGVPIEDLEAQGIDLSLWNDNVKHLAMLYDNSYEFSEDENSAPISRNPMCLLEWLRRNQPNVFAPENELLPAAEGSTSTNSSAIVPAVAVTNGGNGAAALGAGAGAAEYYSDTTSGIDNAGTSASLTSHLHLSAQAASASGSSTLDSIASGTTAGANPTGRQRRKRKNISVIHNYHAAPTESGEGLAIGAPSEGPKKTKRPRKNAKNNAAAKIEAATSTTIPTVSDSVLAANTPISSLAAASPGASQE